MKNIKKVLLLFVGFCVTIVCVAQNNADIVVDINGTGDFTSIQEAINAAPSNSSTATIIFIKRGTYNLEKLIVPASKSNITIVGESREETIISYDMYNCNDGGDGMCPDDKVLLWQDNSDLIRTAATLTIMANDFRAENLTIANTAGPVGQAQALTIRGDRTVFVNCNLTGYQDTIYFWMNETYRAYFKSCMVLGRTDYIYGGGIGYFDECEIRSYGGAWITAPSTTENQDYGFVFYKCNLTYQDNSPRNGDDGAAIKFGRPWHNYPKVAWLYCKMPAEIDPLGWGDKWNMDYADTDTRLHLYEWMNEGAGADMSGRANWAGLRALENQTEANLYEPEIVLAGSDNWNPTAIAPAVTVYNWTGNGTTNNWSDTANWDPEGFPSTGEAASVEGSHTINASGGEFLADLNLSKAATLNITASSTVKLLTLNEATIQASTSVSMSGHIKTKGDFIINSSGNIDFLSTITGVHQIKNIGSGVCNLNAPNDGFSGRLIVEQGEVLASSSQALGNAKSVTVQTSGALEINVSDAILTTTALYTEGEASLILHNNITLNEWYKDGVLQPLGTYNASNSTLIQGEGNLVIGRPSEFKFLGGNWDDPSNFSPALLPEAGEKVIVDAVTIEAQSAPFLGDMHVQNNGGIRLRRQDSESIGTITMYQNTNIAYATSGTGFTLKAPIVLEGDVALLLNSSNTEGSIMNLPGTFSGNYNVRVENTRDVANTATVDLGGDNAAFTGVWDLTKPSANADGMAVINGLVAGAFGAGKLMLDANNQAVFNHSKSAGNRLDLSVKGTAKAVLNVDVEVAEFILNDESMANGTYNSTTHPTIFMGSGSVVVNSTLSITDVSIKQPGVLTVNDELQHLQIYNLLGQQVYETKKHQKSINLSFLKTGVYIVNYKIDGRQGALKILNP
ncbi:pectinesterase family protein [Formosa sp. A9]|uniref:pectinesterase family protein n=1 Tax=Formosa sp. A9 TaxID=3442641 RepID=UPI003EBF7908